MTPLHELARLQSAASKAPWKFGTCSLDDSLSITSIRENGETCFLADVRSGWFEYGEDGKLHLTREHDTVGKANAEFIAFARNIDLGPYLDMAERLRKIREISTTPLRYGWATALEKITDLTDTAKPLNE